MKRMSFALLLLFVLGTNSGCCCLWQAIHAWKQCWCGSCCGGGCGGGCCQTSCCEGGCGPTYWGDHISVPADCCDPCDHCGHWTGPGDYYYGHEYGHPGPQPAYSGGYPSGPYIGKASGPVESHSVVRSSGPQRPTVARRDSSRSR